ncbi:Cytochrome P450 monooxygenase 75 [Psilocybe cubensis]|uniref:Cytochrome P450 monooxygenase 75 n=1 Tax=Psilocybe cubensis TaxID=181762 RepID=A0ACB8H655_PSICU|nr:Cytochrome P450 monooxygenase 75 [Psilocybe cubensis]KAH9483172.1 Cytochrome P450 monooxygenase 75 [Psilocybe cubensis]
MELPPGIIFLTQRAPKITLPPLLTYLAARVLGSDSLYGYQPSWWALGVAMLASLPLAFTAAIVWDEVYIRLDAARKGAVLPPRIGDWTPGNILTLIRQVKSFERGYPGEFLEDICAQVKAGVFNNRIFFENRLVTTEPEHLKAMLGTQFDQFEKGSETRTLVYPLLGTGVFAADGKLLSFLPKLCSDASIISFSGDLWKFHRSMTRPYFTKERISDFENFDRHAEDAISQLKGRLRAGYPVDFQQDLVARFTLDSATVFLFGNDVKSLAGVLPYPHYITDIPSTERQTEEHPALRFVNAFAEAQTIMAWRLRYGYMWPLAEFWHDRIKGPMKVVHDFVDPIVAEAIKKKREGHGNVKEKEEETLLENLVNSTEDHITLRDEIMSLLVAGRDTTASGLTFVVYMLAEYPEVLRRLRAEVLEKVGRHRTPTYDDFREMKYMKAVINETMRLYPAVPFNVRASKCATVLPSKPGSQDRPMYVPANTRLPYATFVMHRRTDLWGPDAREFDPDRFLDDRLHKYLIPNPFIFIPFNAGPRICLGQQFAYHEMSFFLVKLLQQFSGISLASDAQPPQSRPPSEWAEDTSYPRKQKEKIRPKSHLTMYIEGGLWVTMEEAKDIDF